jgi:hypothetical protein
MNTPHYQYFLALEQDFEESIRYVEIDEAHNDVFSVTYLQILVSACIEIEATFKQICRRYAPESSPNNINELREIVLHQKPNFHLTEIEVSRYGRKYKPWEAWGNGENPDWWRAYNNAKHDRGSNYAQANQKNVLCALSALFCNVIYLYADDSPRPTLDPEPKLFYYDSLFPAHFVFGGNVELP